MENSDDEHNSRASFEPEDESILYDVPCQKEFLYFFKKNYDLLITDSRVLIMYKGGSIDREADIKRSISYSRLKGITKSILKDARSFVIHVKNSEDESLFVNDVLEPIDMIKKVYTSLVKKNLPIFGVEFNNLKDFMTTDKDALLGISRMPLKRFRIKDERILTDEDSSDEDEEEKELFNDFLIIDREEANNFSDHLHDANRPEKIEEEQKKMHEGDSVKIVSKKLKNANGSDSDEESSSLDDFEILKVIDKGSFGKVFLVRNIQSKKLYAMKRIRKDILIEKGQIQNTKNEKDILLSIEHPFLLGMDFVFQNDYRIYFFLDYVKGGNLFENLFTVKRFNEKIVKFFAAQLVVAIGCLHDNKIVHRDLKPENVLVEEDGYIKLADFGLAKFLLDIQKSTFSFCGTAEYLAPEILEMKGHDF
jgi:tRNA A-37 threonylcarbamoyl transferase component Bud32